MPEKPSDPELASRVCLALMRVGTRMAVGFDQHFAHFGITQAQFRLLIAVWNCGGTSGATSSALAEYLFLERATVSVMINRLLGEGLLAKLPGENRRSYKLTLTEKSGNLLRSLGPEATALADTTLSSFSAQELQQLEAHLKALEKRLRDDATAHGQQSPP
ncbi:MarR family winged helix-turn-helix transcriptional regulator [Armatimonas rosea]|uniref:DNA-binding MarR family transcriptional regulator n=1 Tax=Armatimonas rosea TaxID=685828 RepID=A0A7W9W6K4_ARMRO|nr:MarR family transcriptional regulator [Armatimonas rosea]MBB6050673.1 DNA-binding MarR family transcriptional regulator [Armatimonas rosea]